MSSLDQSTSLRSKVFVLKFPVYFDITERLSTITLRGTLAVANVRSRSRMVIYRLLNVAHERSVLTELRCEGEKALCTFVPTLTVRIGLVHVGLVHIGLVQVGLVHVERVVFLPGSICNGYFCPQFKPSFVHPPTNADVFVFAL